MDAREVIGGRAISVIGVSQGSLIDDADLGEQRPSPGREHLLEHRGELVAHSPVKVAARDSGLERARCENAVRNQTSHRSPEEHLGRRGRGTFEQWAAGSELDDSTVEEGRPDLDAFLLCQSVSPAHRPGHVWRGRVPPRFVCRSPLQQASAKLRTRTTSNLIAPTDLGTHPARQRLLQVCVQRFSLSQQGGDSEERRWQYRLHRPAEGGSRILVSAAAKLARKSAPATSEKEIR